jgi:hypothetical protein
MTSMTVTVSFLNFVTKLVRSNDILDLAYCDQIGLFDDGHSKFRSNDTVGSALGRSKGRAQVEDWTILEIFGSLVGSANLNEEGRISLQISFATPLHPHPTN